MGDRNWENILSSLIARDGTASEYRISMPQKLRYRPFLLSTENIMPTKGHPLKCVFQSTMNVTFLGKLRKWDVNSLHVSYDAVILSMLWFYLAWENEDKNEWVWLKEKRQAQTWITQLQRVRGAVGALYLAWLQRHFSLRVTQTIPESCAVQMCTEFVCLCFRLT